MKTHLPVVVLLFFSLTSFTLADSAASPFGILNQVGQSLCLAVANPTLLETGTPLKWIQPRPPMRVFDAIVVKPRQAECAFAQDGMQFYEVTLKQRGVDDQLDNAIAIIAPLGRFKDRRYIDPILNGGKPISFRLCNSSEGVHLTAWAGTPLKSHRIWHGYTHLEFDTTPDCHRQEMPDVE
ncbi:hypothetical protein HNQ59_003879 [Chitinivorax tropicus]|uniref:Uncharacterized protein n=1 Tax=Chitinivorax tropicus TaxID=714531 RepID=A0A840MPJ3_9PROT|nr:hypothetical protein [Chitinivorax tropicus]MBB5020558.1 hypothetical protein [Chitinivorax tropicus]